MKFFWLIWFVVKLCLVILLCLCEITFAGTLCLMHAFPYKYYDANNSEMNII